MRLKELTSLIPIPSEYEEIEFTGVTNNSKKVTPGSLFFAVKGFKTDGFLYLTEAIRLGASAAIVEHGLGNTPGFPVIPVENIRKVQGLVADLFYGHPSRKLRVIGVTGTNGKTTVTHLIKHLLSFVGLPVGLMGTVWTDNGRDLKLSNQTTPDSIELQQILAEMVQNGVKYVIMEVSSHALALERVSGLEFDVAILTNVTHDHFDFHKNYQNYFEAKSLLFKSLHYGCKHGKYALLNSDEPSAAHFAKFCQVPVFYYGTSTKTNAKIDYIKELDGTSQLVFNLFGTPCRVETHLPGLFNVYNILAAAGVAFREGISPAQIQAATPLFPGIPGRYQEIDLGQPFRIMVDFAHNPDALDSILQMARKSTRGKIILVFGCEGEKDRLKRPLMGKIAVQNAEIAILTSDNVYNENLEQIFKDVVQDLEESEKNRLLIETDRRAAIKKALELAEADDFILVAGKGHEQYLVKGSEKLYFNDAKVLEELVAENKPSRNAPDLYSSPTSSTPENATFNPNP